MFSILVPTRNRVNNIKKLIENLETTISDYNNVEIYFKCDDDDKNTIKFFENIPIQKLELYWYKDKKSDFLNRDYYNSLCYSTSGNILWAIGDDVRFLTSNWDFILKERIEYYLRDKSDRIAYISIYEENSKAKHPCFPLITKEAFNASGMYFHPQLMSWGADRCLYELYSGIDRILYVPEVHIEHLSYHDGSGEYDETAKSMKERFFRDPNCHNKVCKEIIPKQIEKLRKRINENKKQ